MTPSFNYIRNRLRRGLRRYLRTLGSSNKHYHRSIKHRKRVWESYPSHIRLTIFLFIPIIILITFFKDYISNNPVIIVFILFYVIILFLIEIWYAGSDEYRKMIKD